MDLLRGLAVDEDTPVRNIRGAPARATALDGFDPLPTGAEPSHAGARHAVRDASGWT